MCNEIHALRVLTKSPFSCSLRCYCAFRLYQIPQATGPAQTTTNAALEAETPALMENAVRVNWVYLHTKYAA